jgi:SAM-dependent methyltransferase
MDENIEPVTDDYLALNRAMWDERAPAHAASPGYAVAQFHNDPSFLSGVVRFDLPLLGDIRGQRGVHLQCHIGTDTVSLARLGACMTGLDFSAPALEEARRLAAGTGTGTGTGTEVTFTQANVYDAVEVLGGERFDLVYTGIGAICWLPDIARWAEVVAGLLAPGGRLFLREGHPVLWALDDTRADVLALEHAYFEQERPFVCTSEGTYVPTDVVFHHNVTHEWNHGLGEIVTALLGNDLMVSGLVEHQSVPWEALPGKMKLLPGGEYTLADRPWRLPLSYTLQAVKPPDD